MNAEQLQEFEQDGLTCLRGAVDARAIETIRDRLWEVAEKKRGICRDDRSTWQRVPPAIVKQAKVSDGLFDPMMSDVVCRGIDSLLGTGRWQRPAVAGQLLMSPPDAEHWKLPHNVWHTDFPAPGWVGDVLPGVQLFCLLDRLEPQQGSTLVVAGSHRLTRLLPEREDEDFAGHSADLRKALQRRVPWLRDLWNPGPANERIERFMTRSTDHEGVALRVIETTGEPGDVYFMHLWSLHNASPNCGERMRIVASERIVADGVRLYEFNRHA